jgi:hypothetical protein
VVVVVGRRAIATHITGYLARNGHRTVLEAIRRVPEEGPTVDGCDGKEAEED